MKYDYLVVGSGIFGAVFAHEANKLDKKVLVIDKNNHIGGNCYTEKYEDYHIHKYGAHIFHTSNKEIWDYANKFTTFRQYSHRVKAYYRSKIYSMPINLITMNQVWPDVITPQDAKDKIAKEIIPCNNPNNLEEHILSMVGPTLYNMFIKGYTYKQWGKMPKDLPASIIKRLPIRFNFNERYYHDSHLYEGLPINGYTEMFENLLSNIPVELNVNFFDNKENFEKIANEIVYSGPIDQFFEYCYGDLEYRSLRFENYKMDNFDFQGTSVVNYTDEEVAWTRILQHKYFSLSNSMNDYITYEYSENHDRSKTPYYPINDEINNQKYELYKKESSKLNNYIFGGRLGGYRYLDMDTSIEKALETVRKEFLK